MVSISAEATNFPEFKAVFNRYLANCPRELSDALNNKAYYIARGAARATPVGSRDQIEHELGAVGYRIEYTTKVGGLNPNFIGPIRGEVGGRGQIKKISRKRLVRNIITNSTSLVHLIIQARRRRAGKKGLYGAEMKTAVEHVFRDRFRAVGTLKAGWWAAIRILAAATGNPTYREVGMSRVKGPSTAKIAKPGWNPEVSIEYNVNSYAQPGHQQYIDERIQEALAAAFEEEKQSMERYLSDKLQKQADRDFHVNSGSGGNVSDYKTLIGKMTAA